MRLKLIFRWIERENKVLEDAARKDYNDTVRGIAKFLRGRDPRCR
jgi:hypothetical protein